MSDLLTVRGFVATDIRQGWTRHGQPVVHFRLGSTERRWDRDRNEWADVGTNWYSVSAFRSLATHVTESVRKGEPIIVHGKLRLWERENADGHKDIAPGIDAEAIGHDLGWGTSQFHRAVKSKVNESLAPQPDQEPQLPGQGELDIPY